MANHVIDISVNNLTGDFYYSPSTVRVPDPGLDTVQWQCSVPFALMFREGTPIDHMEIYGGGGPTPMFTVVGSAKGHYHYAVAVFDGTRVFIDSGCPDIIVN